MEPEQIGQLKTWAGQRDAILLEISNLQVSKEKLQKENISLSNSNSDLESRMNQIVGRIEELTKKEKDLLPLILKDVASLQSQKTCLETEIMNLNKILEVLSTQKNSIEKDVSFALSTFEIVNGKTPILEQIIDHVTRVSEDNARDINLLVSNLKKSLEEIIAVNKKNVFETNIVIEKLPKMLVEAQKHGLIKNKI